MSIFSSKLTYGDFRRTGEQDCGNVMDYDDFDLNAGTPEQIVAKAWAEWEADGMEEQWLEQQDPDEWDGLDPHKCYEAWKSGWMGCAERAITHELAELEEDRARDAEYDKPNPAGPLSINLKRLYAWGPKVDETIVDVNEGRLSYSTGTPLVVSRLDSPRGAFFILDGHHRAVEAVLAGKQMVTGTINPELPRLERTGGGYRSVIDAKVNVFDHVTQRAHENPPPKWWRKPAPTRDRPCYRTKIDALRKFLEVNYRIVENYGGADYKVSPSEFDSINHRYDLTGKKACRTIAEAVWAAMPVGKPYCLDRIDLDALNDTSPAREAGVPFVLPDVVYATQMAEEEARHYAAQEPERIFPPVPQIPEGPMRLHLEHRHGSERGVERYQMLPPLPPQPEVRPMRVELEEQEPGVSTFRFGNPARKNMISNPAWVTKLLSKHFVKLEEHIPPKWLPKLTSPSTKQGKFVAAMKEYGCGAYGCVLPTLDPGVVLKVTTDETEAQFAHDMADKLAAPVVVKYHLTYSLPDQYKGLQTYLLWRDSAEHVDKVEQTIAEESGVDPRVVEKAIAGQHEAAQNAFEALDAGRPAEALLKTWEKKTREMGKAVPELRELAEGMITNLHKNKVFFGDVHGGNIGLVNGKWVVVDPGHVAVLEA